VAHCYVRNGKQIKDEYRWLVLNGYPVGDPGASFIRHCVSELETVKCRPGTCALGNSSVFRRISPLCSSQNPRFHTLWSQFVIRDYHGIMAASRYCLTLTSSRSVPRNWIRRQDNQIWLIFDLQSRTVFLGSRRLCCYPATAKR